MIKIAYHSYLAVTWKCVLNDNKMVIIKIDEIIIKFTFTWNQRIIIILKHNIYISTSVTEKKFLSFLSYDTSKKKMSLCL